jgi:hypothetical protein
MANRAEDATEDSARERCRYTVMFGQNTGFRRHEHALDIIGNEYATCAIYERVDGLNQKQETTNDVERTEGSLAGEAT